MKNKRNYYRILHVQPDAPQAIIKSSYRTIMQKLKQHPDVGGDPVNAALINEAYAVISNPETRAEYDRALAKANAQSGLNRHRRSASTASASVRDPNRAPRSVAQESCAFCGTAHPFGRTPHLDATCVNCASPLRGIEKLRLEKTCRRMVHRISKNIHILFYSAWPQKKGYSGIVQDISPRGMQFLTNELPETGTHIKVECEIFSAVARVANHQKRSPLLGVGWVVGVEFVTVVFRETRGSFVSMRI